MRLDVPASTLRFYDKEGLLPFVERLPGGIRMFQDTDLEWLQITGCMKKAGMSIRDIRQPVRIASACRIPIADTAPCAGRLWQLQPQKNFWMPRSRQNSVSCAKARLPRPIRR